MGCMAALLCAALVVLALPLADAGGVTDKYSPACTQYDDPPPQGWQRWSSPSTWPSGVIPGVGANMGVDVNISCNTGVILDLNLTLGTLNVLGSLKVVDSGPFQVFANFIVNQGRITIGSASAPYPGKLIVNITGTTQEYYITRDPVNPSLPASAPRSLGVRAVITLGGVWDVNGMYGNNPGWTTLAQNANMGDTSLVVKGKVGAWPVGGELAIASTDFDYQQAERFFITSVSVSGGNTVLGLSGALRWSHWGRPLDTGIPGVSMDEAAEVLLLTRAIVIQGHPNPIDPLIGGHFIIAQTPQRQSIIGIELINMGQQGRLARYPFHFHLCQDVAGSLAKAISVHDSNQRCYVVHGTWNARLEGNGAFHTKGHCYIVEDGIEFNNTFVGNLGFYTEAPSRAIDISGESLKPIVTDNAPATFWITNPNNSWINNVAAGSSDSGWWFEALGNVAGPSQLFPGASNVYPYYTPIGTFTGNAAHSNGRAGLRTYPSGYRPKRNGGYSLDQATAREHAPPGYSYIQGFRAYKNAFIGMFIHETESIIFDGLRIADNGQVGLELNRDQGITIQNSIFLGETDNVGNPTTCGVRQSGCRPYVTATSPNAFSLNATCSIPTSNSPSIARSYHPELLPKGDLFGILMDSDDFPSHGRQGVPFLFANLTFGRFFSYCRNAAAGMTVNGGASALWTAGNSVTGIQTVDGSAPIWMVRPNQGHLGFEPGYGGAGGMSFFYVMRDLDGSLVGGKGGYAVTANSPAILPISQPCTLMPNWNAYACPGACYRTIFIQGGTYTITRLDGTAVSSQGSQFVNLAANNPYRISFNGTQPNSFTVSYVDYDTGCLDPIVLQFAMPGAGNVWTVSPSSNVFWQACNGVRAPFPQTTQTRYACDGTGIPLLQVTMGAAYARKLVVLQQPGTPPPCSLLQCGIFPSQATWSYNDSGAKPPDFLRAVQKAKGWKTGRAMFGFGGVGENTTIAYPSPGMVTTYFRLSFNLLQAGCMTQLLFGYIADDAIVVYINGGEIFRTNLPTAPTPVTSGTKAIVDVSPKGGWSSFNVTSDLVWLASGQNNIAVELHTASDKSLSSRFDMWMAAIGQNCQSSKFFDPNSQASFLRSVQ